MHRKIIGSLHLAMGALTLIPVLLLIALFGGVWALVARASGGHEATTLLGIGLATILMISVFTALFAAVFGLVAGVGVLLDRKWGDILATALSAVHLFYFPFGTALAGYTVYGLWFAEPAPLRAFPVRDVQTSP